MAKKDDGFKFTPEEQEVFRLLERGWKFQQACEEAGVTDPRQQDSLYVICEEIGLL